MSMIGIKLWINGERLYLSRHRNASVEVNLRAGANYCLIRIYNATSHWRLSMRSWPLPSSRAVISGVVRNGEGKPIVEPNAGSVDPQQVASQIGMEQQVHPYEEEKIENIIRPGKKGP